MENNFTELMEKDQELIETYLTHSFDGNSCYGDLREAMEYSLLSGGKRIRPILTMESCVLCGGRKEDAMAFASGVEMVHTYSLIHDDLPAMDNDDLRRGRPTNHVVYGEATAILAGDGLLTAAFGQIAKADLPSDRIVDAVQCLALNAGADGMVGGQVLDMAGEGRALTHQELEQLQCLKTGALISAAAELGCIAAGGTQEQREKLHEYAMAIGLAFQIRDDMLDVISTDQELGKPVGSDKDNEKTTFVTLLGLEECARLVEELTQRAVDSLTGFEHPEFHIWLAKLLAQRNK